MDISGTYVFDAPPERVWEVLMDATAISACIPGCDELKAEGQDCYRACMTVALSAITGTYDGRVVISDKVPPESYRLSVEGQGKPGFAKGSVTVRLRPEGSGTVVEVGGTVQAGGPIARVGHRLLSSVSKTMQDRFFACLKQKVSG